MKAGDLVLLQGTMWSSYGREGEVGLLLETKLMTERSGYPDTEFSRVLWGNGEDKLYKTEHLRVVQ
tara:strand:- start:481 stop:678 length:198 start_codon:yes stop_codon:yes gene_type:complete